MKALSSRINVNREEVDRARFLLSSSLSLVKIAESNLHVSAVRLESAKKLYPKGLLTKDTFLTVQYEYLVSKIRYDTALEDVQQRWMSLKVAEEEFLGNDR